MVNESEYWLLVHITKRLGRNMFCWPSNDTLREDTGWSINKLQEVKKSLIDKDLIDVEVASGRSNRYHIKTDLIGVFIDAQKLSLNPTENLAPYPKNQQTPYPKNQQTTLPKKPTTKYYSSEVLNSEYTPLVIQQFGEYQKDKPFITIQPKHANKSTYRINGVDGLTEYLHANMSLLTYPEWADKFMRDRNGDAFNDLSHLRNAYKQFVDKQYA